MELIRSFIRRAVHVMVWEYDDIFLIWRLLSTWSGDRNWQSSKNSCILHYYFDLKVWHSITKVLTIYLDLSLSDSSIVLSLYNHPSEISCYFFIHNTSVFEWWQQLQLFSFSIWNCLFFTRTKETPPKFS